MDRWKATALVLAGILVGVVFAGPRVTGAEGHNVKQFTECAWTNVWYIRKKRGGPTKLPEGWTPVGGLGDANLGGGVVICR
ncbi:MAG: hypothetical protein AAGF92_21750 [Myxococcota bacterium]